MDRLATRIRSSDFLRHNIILFVGSAGISVLNYLYYPVLGRMLEPAAFGEVQTVISLFLQIAIFLSVLGLLTVNIVANHIEGKDEKEAQKTIFELERLALVVSLVGVVAAVATGQLLKTFFQFESVWPFILLSLSIVVSVPGAFRMAYLRGKKMFGLNSWAGMIGAAGKLAFSVLLVALGFGVTGAIAGLLIAQLLSFLYAGRKARQHGFGPSIKGDGWKLPDLKRLAPELKYAGLVLCASLAVTVLYSVDVVAVKHYFDAHTAGLYAGIATVARIIFFLTGSIAQVLLPSVKMSHTATQNRAILFKSLWLLVGLGGAALLVMWLVPGLVLRILMGSEYTELQSLLPLLALTVFVVSIINLFIQYHLALRRYAIAIISLFGVVTAGGLVIMNHGSPQAVVEGMLLGSCAMGAAMAVWAVWTRGNSNKTTLSEETV